MYKTLGKTEPPFKLLRSLIRMTFSSNEDSVWYCNRQRKIRFNDRALLKFIESLGRELARGREFAVVIGSDASLRRANRQFRGESVSTDVLSFPDEMEGRLGDILVSAGRAAQQANIYCHGVEEEIKVLILHGLLHLLGYDHESDNGQMRKAERQWRRKYGLEPGILERVLG